LFVDDEQTAIDKKYSNHIGYVEYPKILPPPPPPPPPPVSKPKRISNRLPSIRDTPLSIRVNHLSVGQHLLNVFVCHVESYSQVYIMFGDDYNRATKLFQDMNSCNELIGPSVFVFE
jgi:hypothetical protein